MTHDRKSYEGNPRVRFDDGAGVSPARPRCVALPYTRNGSAIAMAAKWLAVCMMASFALADCALAASITGVKAEDARLSCDNRLCELKQRHERLLVDMTNAVMTARKETSRFTPPFSAILYPTKMAAANCIRECLALRTDVEKADVPIESSEAKSLLLKQIDTSLLNLKKVEEMKVEDLVEMSLRGLRAPCEDDDSARGWSPLALSLVPACEFPNRGANVYGLRLNVIGGSHHDMVGVDLGCIFNSVSNCLEGVQVAGLVNYSREVAGLQFAGLFNGAYSMVGMQGSAVINFTGETDGLQASGLVNIALKMRGCQIAGSGNYSAWGKGCQFAGWANLADKFEGVECGVLNITGDFEGLQIGAVNVANTMSGCQIGLCNVIKTSPIPVLPVVNLCF